MNGNRKPTSVFGQIMAGLEDSIAHSQGKLSLATTELPAPPPKAGPGQVAGLRKQLRMSQTVFAATLNVSTKTVQSWEQGIREPSDAALRMIQVIGRDPEVVRVIFSGKRAWRVQVGPARHAGTTTRSIAAKTVRTAGARKASR
jgi:putative transcriptional regulator